MKIDPHSLIHPFIYNEEIEWGLTKREYFAAMAMQGILANNYMNYARTNEECDNLAKASVNFADAIIEALNKQEVAA